MIKEEKIKEAWGLNYDEFSEHIDSDGWARYPNFQKHEMVEDVRPLEWRSQGTDFRPKSLQGIETNNGWIKIDKEDDLPKEESQLFVVEKITNNIFTFSIFENQGSRKFFLENFTHYQPIEKPKPPIY